MALLEWRRPCLGSLLCGVGLLLFAGFAFPLPASGSSDESAMNWRLVTDSQALCNDYTRAGYFANLRNTDKWLIFFESGSLCYSNDTCNRRFFQSSVRDMYNEGARLDEPFGNFDTERAWKERVLDATEENRVSSAWNTVSPYMSSMQCFQNNTGFFRQASEGQLAVNGTDILNPDCSVNPAFCNYSHVVVPYCSSDLWLASDNNDYRECSCFEYVQNDPACSFTYNPTSPDLQFAFRGRTIFRGVITDLIGLGIDSSSEVVLAGSSAGSVGVLNNAKWVKEEFAREGITANLKVIFESSWFINFQDSISRLFDGAARGTDPNVSQQNGTSLFDVIRSHEVCSFPFRGYPCCVSASCILTQSNSNGSFYPANVPTFGVVSLFDVFILAPALGTLNLGSGNSGPGVAIDFLSLVGEYGGAMNASIARVLESSSSSFLSLYLTSCLQHIYLATSTLWGPEGEPSVFGSSAVVAGDASASFTHQTVSGIWNTAELSRETNNSLLTMSSALSQWQTGVDRWFYSSNNRSLSQLVFRDGCIGVHCNDACPEQFALGVLTSNDWPAWLKIVIAAIVVGLSLICLLVKAMFMAWWFFYVRYRQAKFLENGTKFKPEEKFSESKGKLNLSMREEEDEMFVREVTEAEDLVDGSGGGAGNRRQLFQFPMCSDENAISVACVDIKYSVTFRRYKKTVKNEKTDTTMPVVLTNLEEEEEGEEAKEIDESPQSGGKHLIHRASQMFRALKTPTAPKTPTFPPTTSVKYFSEPVTPGVATPGVEADGSIPAGCFGKRQKEILKGISVYFNPGEMIGVMGPSGSGKTTFLDLLTGRRKAGVDGGSIYVNGVPIDEIRDWYIANTGYVLQLATPYYSELTVRENLTLAAMMKLPDDFPLSKKFRRVEQVMVVTGLYKLADTKVGGVTGPGLSGGQKRRLVIALQLLKMPSVLFLDEPTSGLDATSSMELLNHLNKLADSNRTIILTIHQPRLEIFHMFHRLMLISDGRVAYHGAPEKAYEVFVNALKDHYLGQGLFIPELEDHNPADVIMDMLGNQRMRRIITSYYQGTKEPEIVKRAIIKARYQAKSSSISSLVSVQSALFGTKVENRHAGTFHRMAALETRGSKRADFFKKIYIPVVFFAYAFLLGTVYWQAREAFLIISGFCVYSVASALFMFPFLYLYYQKALEVFTYEHADGTGRPIDIVIQGFIRGTSVATLPVVLCAGLLYILMINMDSWNFVVYAQVALVNVALNQTWIALLIALICAFPEKSFRFSPIVSSIAGFTSGFFIPIMNIPWPYRWLAYINPNFYGFSSSAFLLLTDFETGCEANGGTAFECYTRSAPFILEQFNFENTNPYRNIVILFAMTIIYLLLAVFSNWFRHNTFTYRLKIVKRAIIRKSVEPSWMSEDVLYKESGGYKQQLEKGRPRLVPIKVSSQNPLATIPEAHDVESEDELGSESETEDQTEESEATSPVAIQLEPPPRGRQHVRWKRLAAQTLDHGQNGNGDQMETEFTTEQAGLHVGDEIVHIRPKTLGFSRPEVGRTDSMVARAHHRSHFLAEGHSHKVWNWKPKKVKKRPKLADLVERVQTEQANSISDVVKTGGSKRDTRALSERQRILFDRLIATRAVLREQNEELVTSDNENSQARSRPTLKDISKRVTLNMKLQKQGGSRVHFSDVVSAAVAQHRKEGTAVPHQAAATPKSSVSSKPAMAIPIEKWKSLVKQQRRQMEQESASQRQMSRHTSDSGLLVASAHIDKGSSSSPMKRRKVGQKESLAKRDSVEIGKSNESELQRVKKAVCSKGQLPQPREGHYVESSSSESEADATAPFVHAPLLLLKPQTSSGSLASGRSKERSPSPLSSPSDRAGVLDSPSDALMPSPADLQPSFSGSAASYHLPQSTPGPNAHHGRRSSTPEVKQPTFSQHHLTTRSNLEPNVHHGRRSSVPEAKQLTSSQLRFITNKPSSDFSDAIDLQQQKAVLARERDGHNYGGQPGLSHSAYQQLQPPSTVVENSRQRRRHSSTPETQFQRDVIGPRSSAGHQRRHEWSTYKSEAVTDSPAGLSGKPRATHNSLV